MDDFFFLHSIPLTLCSKKEFESQYRSRIEKVISSGFDEYFNLNFESNDERQKNI